MDVVILHSFQRYPEGGGPREEFLEGFTVTASAEDAAQWIAKGLARAADPAPHAETHAPTE